MRVLFVLEHFYPYIGGAEELFFNLSKALVSNGDEVIVVTTRHDRALPEKENIEGISVHRVDCGNRFMFTFFSLGTVLKYASRCDIIHTTSYNAALPAAIAARLKGKKVVVTFHEVWGRLWFRLPFLPPVSRILYFVFEWILLKLNFDRFIAVSEYTRSALIRSGVNEKRVSMVYNGLEYEKLKNFSHRPPEKFTFCYFGRLGVSKGIEILLQAFERVAGSHSEPELKLILPRYPKALFGKIMKIVDRSAFRNRIIIKHDLPKQELFREVSASSCVVIPSHSEGFCYTALESVAMDVPVISSGKGALREVVSGRHIHLKELNAEQLADAMQQALQNRWDSIPEKKFEFSDSIRGYLNVYKELTGV